MLETLYEQVNNLFQNNQVLSTVAGGSVVVWLVSNIKTIYYKIVSAITAIISFSIINIYEDNRGGGGGWNVTDAQCLFNEFVCNTKAIWERTKNLDLSHNSLEDNNDIPTPTRRSSTNYYKNIANLAYGFSIRIMFGKIVFCNRAIETNQKITVTTVLRVFFCTKKKFLKLLSNHLAETLKSRNSRYENRDTINVYNGEVTNGEKFKRSMDTIFTNNGEHYRLLNSIKSFLNNKDTYRKLSYPYSFSALLYGSPGCGKSSTILAIASALNKDIIYVNLAKITLEKLLGRINVARGDIVVFEDIDALTTPVGESREEEKDPPTPKNDGDNCGLPGSLNLFSSLNGVSLSEILNFTDGLLASDGTICLFTTNHIERLDPALLRAGRMNEIVEFTNLNSKTAAKMIRQTINLHIPPEKIKDDINPAELQAALLRIALGKSDTKDLNRFLNEGEQI